MNGMRYGYGRGLAAFGVAAAVVGGVTACEPTAGGLTAGAVSVTTDRTATSALERLGFKVKWFNCEATVGDGERTAAPTATSAGSRFATVDCEGETNSGRRITLGGRVTDERSGSCVRGDLLAKISGKVVFKATFLGDCEEKPPRTRTPRQPDPDTVTETVTETVTATVTVTATRTER
ncbi:hypothetical protein [Streptomyces sp. NPDC020965]|uniref:hypothetical protein n=1 Tax=Streptomyces sp. NPDC020965 TaxID=3365105 RepID=UPI003791EF10